MIRVMVVEDEPLAREELEFLLRETGEFEIVGSCAHALEALRLLHRQRPEVLFLDIQMPIVDGFELLGMIDDEAMPHVVFVTAYDAYALQAFEEKTLDYLLKPVERDRLQKTVKKLKAALQKDSHPVYRVPDIRRIPCLSERKIKLVALDEVEFVRSDPTGVFVVTPEGEFFTELTLKVLEARASLLRCHKQYLANLDRVDEIVPQDSGRARLRTRSGRSVPVSRRYLKNLKDAFLL